MFNPGIYAVDPTTLTGTVLGGTVVTEGVVFVTVFVIATAVAYWYYRDDSKSVCYGYGLLRYNVGSITFAAIVITLITLARRAAQQ